MVQQWKKLVLCAALCTVIVWPPSSSPQQIAKPKRLKHKLTANAWTYAEAAEASARHPDNAYLQYVRLQLARNEGKRDQVRRASGFIWRQESERTVDLFSLFTGTHAIQESLQLDAMLPPREKEDIPNGEEVPPPRKMKKGPPEVPPPPPAPPGYQPTLQTIVENDVKVVTETEYQRDIFASEEDGKPSKGIKVTVPINRPYTVTRLVEGKVTPPQFDARLLLPASISPLTPLPGTLAFMSLQSVWPKWAQYTGFLSRTVPIAALTGPATKSHPWKKLLAGRAPAVSHLARCVPEDFYLAEFRSVSKLLDILAGGDEWAGYLQVQAALDAGDQRTRQRLQAQLLLETPEALRPFFDRVIGRVGIAGSDLFLKEGSDVTFLFHLKQPALYRAHAASVFQQARQAHRFAQRASGEYLGVSYIGLVTADRLLSVYAADPKPDLHVRSNSLAGLRRVLEVIQGKDGDSKPVHSLGASDEFQYIRTLWPDGAAEEDGIVYFSDAFVRHMVGPQLKLAERRRLICYNHLRMIGHACQMYRTQYGVVPDSLETLFKGKCCPGEFNKGTLACPCGGKYTLSADRTTGICSIHGTTEFMVPCLELPLKEVSKEEADAYRGFIKDYSEYWRTFFDPIAVRLQHTPKKLRVETMILPLIEKSIYTDLAKFIGGKPVRLGAQPVPKRNLFSMHLHFNRDELLKAWNSLWLNSWWIPAGMNSLMEDGLPGSVLAVCPTAGFPAAVSWRPIYSLAARDANRRDLLENNFGGERLADRFDALLSRGIGEQLGVHLYDTPLTFDINFSEGLGGLFRLNSMQAMYASAGVLAAGFFTPYYITLDVRDSRIVNEFLDEMERVFVKQAATLREYSPDWNLQTFAMKTKAGSTMRAIELRMGPARYRIYWTRVGNQLVVTNQPYVIDDLRAIAGNKLRDEENDVGHALIRVRPRHWKDALAGYQIGWAANNRDACVKNLGMLSSTARAFHNVDSKSWDDRERKVAEASARLHGVHCACPDGGRYQLAKDSKTMTCSVHGSADNPRQSDGPADESPIARLMRRFADLSATLTLQGESLRAVVVLETK